MSWLLDVNLILASRWTTHAEHASVKAWLDSVEEFHTCSITELGFVRISLSFAYNATWDEVQESLGSLHARVAYRFLADDVDGTSSPQTISKDTTDAHLVSLSRKHGLRLATLDMSLVTKPWAKGVAENPLRPINARESGR